jgi:hypothetical protein
MLTNMDFLLNGEVFQFPSATLRQTCTTFARDPLPPRYSVNSSVSSKLFRTFLSALKGDSVEVTKENFAGLSALCREFGFEFHTPSYRIAELETTVKHLQDVIFRLWELVIPIGSLDSRIISDFPEIFTEFRDQRFPLLWRGSRDGFKAKEFHRRCDGHGNTLTVILDTNGNIFGGFTRLEWDSRRSYPYHKTDGNMESFLFTLKNPHNITARRFMLMSGDLPAIICSSQYGPNFHDIKVSDNCNTNTLSSAGIGNNEECYIIDVRMDSGKSIFTGSMNFQVKEIEVFELVE